MRNVIYTALRNPDLREQYFITSLVMEGNSSIIDDFKSEVKMVVVNSKKRLKIGVMRVYQFMMADKINNHEHEAKDIFHVFEKIQLLDRGSTGSVLSSIIHPRRNNR